MKRFRIVKVDTPHAYYYEVYRRFLGFLWWKMDRRFKAVSYNDALHWIQEYYIEYKEEDEP